MESVIGAPGLCGLSIGEMLGRAVEVEIGDGVGVGVGRGTPPGGSAARYYNSEPDVSLDRGHALLQCAQLRPLRLTSHVLAETPELLVDAIEPLVDAVQPLVDAIQPLLNAIQPLLDACAEILELSSSQAKRVGD